MFCGYSESAAFTYFPNKPSWVSVLKYSFSSMFGFDRFVFFSLLDFFVVANICILIVGKFVHNWHKWVKKKIFWLAINAFVHTKSKVKIFIRFVFSILFALDICLKMQKEEMFFHSSNQLVDYQVASDFLADWYLLWLHLNVLGKSTMTHL